jgi:hypothetical protein
VNLYTLVDHLPSSTPSARSFEMLAGLGNTLRYSGRSSGRISFFDCDAATLAFLRSITAAIV